MAEKFFDRALANEFGKDYKKVLVSLLKNNRPYAKVASGDLINSINYRLQDTANGINVILLAEDYLKFVDQGVNGTQRGNGSPYSYKKKYPPIQAIQQWVSIKGLPQEAAWAIRANIFKFGIKPTRVLAKTRFTIQTNRLYVNKYENMIVDKLSKDIEKEWMVVEKSLRLNKDL